MKTKHLIMLVLNTLIILTAVTLSLFLYMGHKNTLLKAIDIELWEAAVFAREILTDDYHDNIIDKQSVSKDDFDKIVDRNNRLCLKLNLQYLWSVIKIDEKFHYTSSTSPSKDYLKGDQPSFFEISIYRAAYEKAAETMTAQYTSYSNKWGAGRLVVIPSLDSMGRKYFVGASKSLNTVNEILSNGLTHFWIIIGAVLCLGLVINIVLSNHFAKKTMHLTQIAKNIANGDLDQKIEIRGSYELANLSQSIMTMAQSVKDKIEDISNKNKILSNEIIERKQAESALKDSEEKYRTLFHGELDAIAMAEVETGNMLEVNQSFISTYGYSREEALGMKNTDFSIEPEATKGATQNRSSIIPIRWHKKKDGTIFPVEITSSIFDYKGREVHIAAIRDITERKKAEDELLRTTFSKDYVDNILKSMVDTLIVVNPDATIRIVNQATLDLLGYEEHDLLDKKITEIIKTEEEEDDDEQGIFHGSGLKKLIEKGFVQSLERTYLTKDGARIHVQLSGSVMHDKNGEIQGIVCVSHDTTLLKHTVGELQKAHDELENRVAARTKELSESNDRLTREIEQSNLLHDKLVQSERMAAVGKLAGTVAHEINSPLQGITFMLDFVKSNAPALSNDIDLIKQSFISIRDTVKNLLDLSRPVKSDKMLLSINDIIENTYKLYQGLLKKNRIKANLELSANIPKIFTPQQQLSQVFINLFNNTIEAISETSGSKGYPHNGHHINIKTTLHDKNIITTFSDTGPGIGGDDLNKIFDPFFTKKAEIGLG